jgi:exosortase
MTNNSTVEHAIASRSQIARWTTVFFFAALWFVLCRHLSTEWKYNDQYGYGWFVPFLAVYLFWLRWESRPPAGGYHLSVKGFQDTSNQERITNNPAAAAIGAAALLLLLLPLRLFEIPNPAWRALAWIHAGVVATLTLLAIWIAGGKSWVRHFAFPIGFFFVAVPWFSGIEEPLVQGLMHLVAAIDAEILNLLGIPAQVEGSVIRVNAGLVGVNEACSGVRSLQTSLMIGLLFGELKRLSILRRIALVVGAVAIALLANISRAFFLVWMAATRGLNAMEHGHDVAGYAVLVAVVAGSIGLAAFLARNKVGSASEVEIRKAKVENAAEIRDQNSSFLLPNFYFLLSALIWLVLVEISAESWYRFHERRAVPQPQWTIRWPQGAPGFREIQLNDEAQHLLRCDVGREAVWRGEQMKAENASEPQRSFTLFFLRWRPGQDSALLANIHRPDICLPATGWHQTADLGFKSYPIATDLSIPFHHFEFLHQLGTSRQEVAHVFYCLWQDRVSTRGTFARQNAGIAYGQFFWSRSERMRVVLEGTRNAGQQVMELVMTSPDSVTAAEAEARFASLVQDLVQVEIRK